MLVTDLERVIGEKAYAADGDKLGTVGAVYLDDASRGTRIRGRQDGTVRAKESFVPVREGRITDDGLVLPYSKDMVKEDPAIDTDGHMSPVQERELFDYYAIPFVEHSEPVEGHGRSRQQVATDSR